MVTLEVTPCHPTIGKVHRVLQEVFKLSRVLGTFPFDADLSGISKYNFAKGIIIYLFAAVYAINLLRMLWSIEKRLASIIAFSTQILLHVLIHWINLYCLIANRQLLKEFYDDLMDVEYNLWLKGVNWTYKPSWCVKYLSFVLSLIYLLTWDTIHGLFYFFIYNIVYYLTIPSVYSILSQYIALLQICRTLLRSIRLLQDTRTVVRLTEKVLDLCRKVNTLYEKQILFYIVAIFFIYLFIIYSKIIGSNVFEKNYAWHAVRLFMLLHPLFSILLCVGRINKEVKKIEKKLYTRLLFNLDDETLQFHLIAKREIVFTAGGFFPLGNTLIWSMFTTTINYLIFLVQYM